MTDEFLQAGYALMDALFTAAGVGVMNENRLPDVFKIVNQDMMGNPVAEIGGENLPELGFFGKKADGTAGTIGMILQFPAQFEEFSLLFHFKPQGIDGVSFVFPAQKILPVDIFETEKQEQTLSAAQRQPIFVVVLVVVVLVAVVEIEVPGVIRIGCILRTGPVPGRNLSTHFPPPPISFGATDEKSLER
ncbi:MAG: hypothetical protein U9Q39_06705 [Pseudomonadota bacterium]|nr:hypothetical protein [Pseudomonadota bacterium]